MVCADVELDIFKSTEPIIIQFVGWFSTIESFETSVTSLWALHVCLFVLSNIIILKTHFLWQMSYFLYNDKCKVKQIQRRQVIIGWAV